MGSYLIVSLYIAIDLLIDVSINPGFVSTNSAYRPYVMWPGLFETDDKVSGKSHLNHDAYNIMHIGLVNLYLAHLIIEIHR